MNRRELEKLRGDPLSATRSQIERLVADYETLLDWIMEERGIGTRGDAIRRGMERAKAEGKHVGRPRKAVDMQPIVDRFVAGDSLKQLARTSGESRSTIRRRLEAMGFDVGSRA